MTAHHACEVLRHARDHGVRLWAEGGRLRYQSAAPLNPDMAELLKLWKEPLLHFLTDWTLADLLAKADPEEAAYLVTERAAIAEAPPLARTQETPPCFH